MFNKIRFFVFKFIEQSDIKECTNAYKVKGASFSTKFLFLTNHFLIPYLNPNVTHVRYAHGFMEKFRHLILCANIIF